MTNPGPARRHDTMASVLSFPAAATATGDAVLFQRVASDLERQGYTVLPDALPEFVRASLLDHLASLETERFHAAAIGRGQDQLRNRFVRRDRIHWIDEVDPRARAWRDWTRALRQYLNRHLYLGLFSFESHFSFYQPGDFYRKHVDAFTGRSNRVLSLVTYLNRGWEPDQGGELVLYPAAGEEPLLRVRPAFGTLVLFLSTGFPHEVLPASRERFGVAGWFRINASINDSIDPPR